MTLSPRICSSGFNNNSCGALRVVARLRQHRASPQRRRDVLEQTPSHRLLQGAPRDARRGPDPQRAHALLSDEFCEARRAPQLRARAQHVGGVRGERGDSPRDGAGDQRVQRGDLSSLRGGEIRHRRARLGVHEEVQTRKRRVARERRTQAAEQPARAFFAGHLPQRVENAAVGDPAHRRVLHARLDHRDGAQRSRGERS
mmetsp:Transcript_4981/g.19960  ORF Transcript_4981/g.19960 Transcript_4981/m.19960 type:complete len:200 (+) Transcript_4981:766-1365(+)